MSPLKVWLNSLRRARVTLDGNTLHRHLQKGSRASPRSNFKHISHFFWANLPLGAQPYRSHIAVFWISSSILSWLTPFLLLSLRKITGANCTSFALPIHLSQFYYTTAKGFTRRDDREKVCQTTDSPFFLFNNPDLLLWGHLLYNVPSSLAFLVLITDLPVSKYLLQCQQGFTFKDFSCHFTSHAYLGHTGLQQRPGLLLLRGRRTWTNRFLSYCWTPLSQKLTQYCVNWNPDSINLASHEHSWLKQFHWLRTSVPTFGLLFSQFFELFYLSFGCLRC